MADGKRRIATGSAEMRTYELWSDGSFTYRQDGAHRGRYGSKILIGAPFETREVPSGLRWYLNSSPEHHERARAWLVPFNPSWVGVYEPKRGAA